MSDLRYWRRSYRIKFPCWMVGHIRHVEGGTCQRGCGR